MRRKEPALSRISARAAGRSAGSLCTWTEDRPGFTGPCALPCSPWHWARRRPWRPPRQQAPRPPLRRYPRPRCSCSAGSRNRQRQPGPCACPRSPATNTARRAPACGSRYASSGRTRACAWHRARGSNRSFRPTPGSGAQLRRGALRRGRSLVDDDSRDRVGIRSALVASLPLPMGASPRAADFRIEEIDWTRTSGCPVADPALLAGRSIGRPLPPARSCLPTTCGSRRRSPPVTRCIRLIGTDSASLRAGGAMAGAGEGQSLRVRTETGRMLVGTVRERAVEVKL